MYCHQHYFGGKYDLIQLHRQIELYIKMKTTKMTWLHMEFVLFFITGPSQAKLGRMAQQQLLTIALLPVTIQEG